MNQHDRDNLKFLLTASRETLQDWYNKMDEDDLLYAMELLDAYSKELDVRSALLEEPRPKSKKDPYPEANVLLAKFRL
jgi:hypothetical protein